MRERSAKQSRTAVAEFAERREERAGSVRERAVGGDGHETLDFKPGKGVDHFQIGEEFVGLETEFGGVPSNVDFEEDRHAAAEFGGPFIQLDGEGKGIDALHHLKKLDGIAAFVRLEMADHVPLQAAGAERDFGSRFLDFALAEGREAELGGGGNGFGRLPLAHGEEKDFGGGAACTGARGLDAGLKIFVAGGWFHRGKITTESAGWP